MGIFSDFKQSLAESAGRILLGQLADTRQKMMRLSEPVRNSALEGFIRKRDTVIANLDNMSHDGCIQLGQSLQKQARQTLDMNLAEGYALWLTGAWLESGYRPGKEAAQVCSFLNETALAGGGKDF